MDRTKIILRCKVCGETKLFAEHTRGKSFQITNMERVRRFIFGHPCGSKKGVIQFCSGYTEFNSLQEAFELEVIAHPRHFAFDGKSPTKQTGIIMRCEACGEIIPVAKQKDRNLFQLYDIRKFNLMLDFMESHWYKLSDTTKQKCFGYPEFESCEDSFELMVIEYPFRFDLEDITDILKYAFKLKGI